jgi:single-stranded-DNA-specific exonuclease
MCQRYVTQSPYKSLDDIFAVLLANRGISSKREIEDFLFPELSKITHKSVGIDEEQLERAIKRIQKAIKLNQKIIIFGDYDVDGITGTAILWESIYQEYKNVSPYIPDRFEEGYGLSVKGIDNLLKKYPDTKLIITVDNGIVAYEALKHAKKLKIDVIVTDHHVKGKEELDCFALIHTTQICGAAVGYMLSLALRNQPLIDSDQFLDLVALATVADLVPLTGASRAFVKFGLEALLKIQRPGLQALFNLSGIGKDKIGVYEIGHVIGPRLNASGRILSAMDSLRLLCTKRYDKGQELAVKLDQTNKERQLLTEEFTQIACSQCEEINLDRISFVSHTDFNEGVIGLVASRLVERYYKPSFVVSIGKDISKGSARSISGVNIIEMIRAVGVHVVQAGGHPMAAGFTVETTKIEILRDALQKHAEKIVADEHLERKLSIDLKLKLDDITMDLYKKIQLLAPFGMKNPEPLFVSKKVIIEEARAIGANGKHLKLKLNQESRIKNQGDAFDAVAFGMGEKISDLKTGSLIDIVYTIDLNVWRGKESLQLKIKDLK